MEEVKDDTREEEKEDEEEEEEYRPEILSTLAPHLEVGIRARVS